MKINARVFQTAWKESILDRGRRVAEEFATLGPEEEITKAISGAIGALAATMEHSPSGTAAAIRVLLYGFFTLGRQVGKAEAEIKALEGMDAT